MNRSLNPLVVVLVLAVGGSAYWAMAQTDATGLATDAAPSAPVAVGAPAPSPAAPSAPASPGAPPAEFESATVRAIPARPVVAAAPPADVLVEVPRFGELAVVPPRIDPGFIVKEAKARISMEAVTDRLLDEYSKEGSDKEKVVGELRKLVTAQFNQRQAERAGELQQLEAQIQKLRAIQQQREAERDRIVEDRVRQLLREAAGLGWGNNERKRVPFGWRDAAAFERQFDFDFFQGPDVEMMAAARADEARQRAQDELDRQAKQLEQQRARLEKTMNRLKEEAPQGEQPAK